jgi:Ca2+-binding RTX toxin-like protein
LTGSIEFMPINGLENWKTAEHDRAFWMVEATLDFIEASDHRDRVNGIVTDTEFASTQEWALADDAGKADILSQYVTLLEGINDRVEAFDAQLTTATYHGAFLDMGDTRFELDGVNYGNSAVLGAHVDTIILPIRLTDVIDPDVAHDFDELVARALTQTSDELANLETTSTRIVLDFEWEESHRDLGSPNYFAQLEAAISDAVQADPAFEGFAVFIHPTLSTVEVTDLSIEGLATAEVLQGTIGNDTIAGNGGNDLLIDGLGNDVYRGGDGLDTVSISADRSAVNVTRNENGDLVLDRGTEVDLIDASVESITFNGETFAASAIEPGIFIEAKHLDIGDTVHMYLVYRDAHGNEWVLRSGPAGSLFGGDMDFQINVPIDESFDARGGMTPEQRYSTRLVFDVMTDDEAWALMVRYSLAFEAEDYVYELFGTNSNSYVGAMVASAGLDPFAALPSGVTTGQAVGVENYSDMLLDVTAPPNGHVLGTAGHDTLAGIQVDDFIFGLAGNDNIAGVAGDDDIEGGEGDDTVSGGLGNDHLKGGIGSDQLDGGLGNDTLTGGGDEDLFIYSGGADVIEDFSGDLIQIERSQYSGSVDALLAGATVVSGNLVFDFGGGYSLTLTGVTSTAGLEGRVRIGAADPGHDVSGDGTSDILLRSATGALGFYDMAGGTPSWSGLGTVATSWTVATTGDFNGDGTDDILLRNSSGATGYYDMDGGTPTWVGLGTVATSWTAIGSDDFNGDGIDDILWRSTTGAAGYYDMDGGTPTWVGLGSVPTSWDIVGTGDFNGDGTDDILWRNSSGVTGFYDMDGGTPSWVGLGSVATNWSVVATGDFNGDGTDDILWRNSSGVTGFYDMDGGTPSWVGLGTVALSWDIVGTGDFNGDGTDDILWRNTSGALGMYDMDNGNPTWVGLGALGLQWDVPGQFVDEFIF